MQITIDLDDDLVKKVEADAARDFRTRKWQIEFVLKKYYDELSFLKSDIESLDKTHTKITKSSAIDKVLNQL